MHDQEGQVEKEMATHSSTLAWKSPWTKEPGRLQFMGLQRVGHDWAASLHFKKDKKLYFSDLIKGGHEGTQIINCPFSGTLKCLGHFPSREKEAFLLCSGRRWVMKGKKASSGRAILRVQVEAEDTSDSLKPSHVWLPLQRSLCTPGSDLLEDPALTHQLSLKLLSRTALIILL